MAVDMVDEKVITEREALLRIDVQRVGDFFVKEQRRSAIQPTLQLFARGVAASQGIASGLLVFSSHECLFHAGKQRERVVLCLGDSKSSDARAIRLADAVILLRGDVLSNAAIICRAMGKPCVAGLQKDTHMSLSADGQTTLLASALSGLVGSGGNTLRTGSMVTVDGGDGKLYSGSAATGCQLADPNFQKLLAWADKYRKLRVLTNVCCPAFNCESRSASSANLNPAMDCSGDITEQTQLGFQLGADGIGCLSTDNLFCINDEALAHTRRILMTVSAAHRNSGFDYSAELQPFLSQLGAMQKERLTGVFTAAAQHGKGGAINIKLLDKALCSFLPSVELEAEIVATALNLNVSVADIKIASGQLVLMYCRSCSMMDRSSLLSSPLSHRQSNCTTGIPTLDSEGAA